jgi:ligand-binding sensor domain-containing protein
LPGDEVFRIFQDSHGFIRFCSSEGLSRYDGYQFTNYGVAQGLPHRIITDIVETSSGKYWIATYGGLAKYDPTASNPGQATTPGAARTDRKFVFSTSFRLRIEGCDRLQKTKR